MNLAKSLADSKATPRDCSDSMESSENSESNVTNDHSLINKKCQNSSDSKKK